MNDEFTDFENELRQLRPAALNEPLIHRVAAILGTPERRTETATWWQRIGFNRRSAALCWGILSPGLTAAAVVAVLQITGPARSGRSPAAKHDPSAENPTGPAHGPAISDPAANVRATNVLYAMQDDGVVLDSAQEPVHRVRYRSADLVEWRNPGTGARWEVSYPREDIALVPIHAN